MARIRSIKPEFFRNETLYELEIKHGLPIRVAFAGLWTACDREGRFKWKPRELKLDCLPYDEVDFELILNVLVTNSSLLSYEVDGEKFGCIPKWHEHQRIRNDEAASVLPAIEDGELIEINDIDIDSDEPVTKQTRNHVVERKGKERKGYIRALEINFEEIENLYNELLPELPACKLITDKRKAHIRAAIKQFPEASDLEFWRKYFTYVSGCPFLMGEKSDWKASFDFLINKNNILKVREGKYDAS